MNDLISRQAAIAMAEKIVDEIENLTIDKEEKEVWARALMESILPAEVDHNISIDGVWKVNTNIVPDGGFGIDWSCDLGWGQLELYWGDDDKIHADTECMGKNFVKQVLTKLIDELVIDG